MFTDRSTVTVIANGETNWRSRSPVFVVGCPRSGTTLLYHMLLSAGNFAVYRTEANDINLLEPRFGDLSVPRKPRRLLAAGYNRRLYTLFGLDTPHVEGRAKAESPDAGDMLSDFIDHDLDYDRIQRVRIGSVGDPNTSFRSDGTKDEFNPIGRWRRSYSAEHLTMFESLVGTTLQTLGYELAAFNPDSSERSNLRRMRSIYQAYFDTKLHLKAKTPLGPLFAA